MRSRETNREEFVNSSVHVSSLVLGLGASRAFAGIADRPLPLGVDRERHREAAVSGHTVRPERDEGESRTGEVNSTETSSSDVEETVLIFPIRRCVLLDSSGSFQIDRIGL